ncbi:MAG TPA: hypothetical protein EYG03_21795 [Planctomycetes bacterium]|nr:hypothetical protein [Planctomycetota bacterium]
MTFFIRVSCAQILTLLCCTGTSTVALAGHPISVTETQVFVTRTAARVRIKLFAEDLFLFQGLEPDEQDVISAAELSRGLEQHKQFLLDKFTLRDAKGDAFKGSVTDVQRFEIPEEGIPVDDLMLFTATYELEYPFAEPPEFLTLQQDISDENFIFPSEMKLTLHQAGTEMTYTESLKPGAAETLRFDWDQQELSDDSSDEDWEAWFEKQREATLGITSYSSVYSFIYIEPAEVRHEVLIPLASLRTIMPMEHKDPAFIEVGEQDGVRALIRDWLSGVNPTTINGVAVEPEFTRIDFYGLDLKDFARQAEQRRVSLANGRVGVIMTYRTVDDSVREAGVTWNKFHSSLRKVQSVVFSYPDRMQRFEFSRFNEPVDNVFRWTADETVLPQPVAAVSADVPPLPQLVVPVASICAIVLALACAIFGKTWGFKIAAALCVLGVVTWPFARIEVAHPFAPLPEVADTDRIFKQLHTGAYRALDFGTEDRIYEALNQSVDGPLLESLYLQLRESLQIREQGGAVARVRAVEYDDGQQAAVSPHAQWPGFRYRSRWTVSGTVEHWGHVHERQNQFATLFSVEPRDGQWKITEMQIEDQKSIATKTRLRKF